MAGWLDLTKRERDILKLVLAGRTNKAIAAEFGITEKTIEFHLDNLYTKIGVRTRLLAGVWAMNHGIELEPREIPSFARHGSLRSAPPRREGNKQ